MTIQEIKAKLEDMTHCPDCGDYAKAAITFCNGTQFTLYVAEQIDAIISSHNTICKD